MEGYGEETVLEFSENLVKRGGNGGGAQQARLERPHRDHCFINGAEIL